MNNPKNYIGMADDHSTSMGQHGPMAIHDKNLMIESIRNASSREVQDTIVYSVDFANTIERTIVNSNPHVLKPIQGWPCRGMTAFYDAMGDLIKQLKAVPDYDNPNVSFLVIGTTDGEENHSVHWSDASLSAAIKELQATGRWTFVLRVPRGAKNREDITCLGIPAGNIQEWDTTNSRGMAESTAATTQGVDDFFAARAAGKRGSTTFYSDASNINLAALEPVDPKKFSLYISGEHIKDTDGMMISDFIMLRRAKYMKGAAFYQLVKTENRVERDKAVLVRERTTGKVFQGDKARKMIGLPTDTNARLHPGNHLNYDIFIQSSSWNRKIPTGSGVIYWAEKGTDFTQEEIDRFTKPADPVRTPKEPVVKQLPAVNNTTGRPVHSTMPITQKRPVYFASRDDARRSGHPFKDNGKGVPKSQRWERL